MNTTTRATSVVLRVPVAGEFIVTFAPELVPLKGVGVKVKVVGAVAGVVVFVENVDVVIVVARVVKVDIEVGVLEVVEVDSV